MDGCGRRLSTTRLFAAVAGGGRSWARADVSRAAVVCDLRRGPAALSWFRGLACDGALILAHAALLPAVAAVEHRPAYHRGPLSLLHASVSLRTYAAARWRVERARAHQRGQLAMTTTAQLRSGKGAADENFTVAPWILQRRHRQGILALYEFVRVADDIADHRGPGET